MADKGCEFYLEVEDIEISQVVIIQAAVRGVLVRKWMRDVRRSFDDVFNDVEKNSTVRLDWKRDQPCKPKVIRTKTTQKKEKKDLTVADDTSNQSVPKQITSQRFKTTRTRHTKQDQLDAQKQISVEQLSNGNEDTSSEISDTQKAMPEFTSVEIQTSFIDVNLEHVPSELESRSNKLDYEVGNIIEDLDTSWKDRVEPFVQNNFEESKKEVEPNNELHLSLDTDGESLPSQRSDEISSKSTPKDDESQPHIAKSQYSVGKAKSDVHERLENLENDQGRKDCTMSSTSDTSSRSRSSSVKRYNEGEKIEHGCQSSRSRDRISNRSQCSNRIHVSDQKLYDTEMFSPRGQRSNTSQHSDGMSQQSHRSKKGSESQLRQNSVRTGDRRRNSQTSEDSLSHRSDQSEDRKSQQSRRSQRSCGSEGQRSERSAQFENMSRASPVEFHSSSRDHIQEDKQGRPPLQDSTTLTNVTSVWDSFNSFRDSNELEMPKPLPQDASKLKELRKNISMELLWVQQAIDSRKNYLKLKGKM